MNKISYFNVIGPVMIGPSSSHTAGAVRIGLAARAILEEGFHKINFKLYGSFAKTYKGHGTDKALIAGALGMMPHEERIKVADDIAREMGIEVNFTEVQLAIAHPNTAIVEFWYPDGRIKSVQGVSLGGGQIEIVKIDGQAVKILPGDPTLVLQYKDRKGVISAVSTLLAKWDYNIETITNNRDEGFVTLVIILDKKLEQSCFEKIKGLGIFDHSSYVYF